jgi:hypothetical protein
MDRLRLLLLAASCGFWTTAAVGCSESHEMLDAGRGSDAGGGSSSDAGDAATDSGSDAATADGATDAAPDGGADAGSVACGSVVCPAGQICCFSTLTCFDPRTPTACSPATSGACASNADCPRGQWCYADTCAGDGVCRSVDASCPLSGPTCGCDGITYPSYCAAQAAGVRYHIPSQACGAGAATGTPTTCGPSAPCPTDTGVALNSIGEFLDHTNRAT